MAGEMGFTLRDRAGQKSNFRFSTGDVTAVSLPGLLTQTGTLRAAVEGITLGIVSNERLTVFDTLLSNDLPASAYARREKKWLVTYEDVTEYFDDPVNAIPNEGFNKRFQVEIPTADEALLVGTSEYLDITTGVGQTFANAFEATARSPHGGEVNVLSVKFVGRNL